MMAKSQVTEESAYDNDLDVWADLLRDDPQLAEDIAADPEFACPPEIRTAVLAVTA